MAERRSVILKRSGKTPTLGMCEKCQIKFFTPRGLTHRPKEAEQNLWQKFSGHACKDEKAFTPPHPQGLMLTPKKSLF